MARLIKRNPRADEAELLEEFRASALADREMLDTIIEYWFSNNFLSLTSIRAPRRSAQQAAKQVEEVKASVVSKIKLAAKIVLLEMAAPNGKRLSACSKEECAHFGGWYIKVAAKLEPGQTVGSAFDEAALRKLWPA